jgi:hypothetical protein
VRHDVDIAEAERVQHTLDEPADAIIAVCHQYVQFAQSVRLISDSPRFFVFHI